MDVGKRQLIQIHGHLPTLVIITGYRDHSLICIKSCLRDWPKFFQTVSMLKSVNCLRKNAMTMLKVIEVLAELV